MPVRKEWTEWHLTPRGWERGSTRSGGKNNWADEPEDRVLSFSYHELETSAQPETQCSFEETWRSKTATNIDELVQAHGDCPQKL